MFISFGQIYYTSGRIKYEEELEGHISIVS